MDVNQETVDLIKGFEGWRAKAYRDAVGVLTIGYGHTTAAGAPEVKAGMTITLAEGEAILRTDLRKYAKAITEQVKVPLNANQFGALVSWCYNVGPGNTAKSTLIKKLNRGEYDSVPAELMKWTKAGGKTLKGLIRRRETEGKFFASSVSAPPRPEVAAPPTASVPPAPVSPVVVAPPVSSKGGLVAIASIIIAAVAAFFGLK